MALVVYMVLHMRDALRRDGLHPCSPLWVCLCAWCLHMWDALRRHGLQPCSTLVALFVAVHGAALGKALVTLVALEWFFTRVSSLMIYKDLKFVGKRIMNKQRII